MAFQDIKYFFFHGKLYRIVADRLQLLLVDTLCRLSHLLGWLKTNLSNWLYFSFAVACSQHATEQAYTAPTSTLPPTINPSLLPRQPYSQLANRKIALRNPLPHRHQQRLLPRYIQQPIVHYSATWTNLVKRELGCKILQMDTQCSQMLLTYQQWKQT